MQRAIVIAAMVGLFAALATVGVVIAKSPTSAPRQDVWTAQDRALLEGMRLPNSLQRAADPSNAVETSAAAASLGPVRGSPVEQQRTRVVRDLPSA